MINDKQIKRISTHYYRSKLVNLKDMFACVLGCKVTFTDDRIKICETLTIQLIAMSVSSFYVKEQISRNNINPIV